MERHLFNIQIALGALFSNRLRSLLTALGIIFGVAAVITMLAIGRGAKQEILDQLELVGVNNIVIDGKVVKQGEKNNNQQEEDGSQQQESGKQKASPGLSLQDALAIQNTLPSIRHVSPEVVTECQILRKGIYMDGRLIGVDHNYFELNNFDIRNGKNFSALQLKNGDPVCIIGEAISKHFFGNQNPVGKRLKAGDIWLTVIGVLAPKAVTEEAKENLGLRNFNKDIYTPVQTMLLRMNDRSDVNLDQGNQVVVSGGMVVTSGSSNGKDDNYNQLDRIVVQVAETDKLEPIADVIRRMMKRRHNGVEDFEITVPILLLQQQQRAKSIFNIVLGAIAGISLLVGGIGIMNIMLASVMERIREIGIRRALGARKSDIISQFLMESVLISLSGGIIGVVLGVAAAVMVSEFTDILTIISAWSIIISFGIAFIIGLIFGISPARKAAYQDPIESLRHE